MHIPKCITMCIVTKLAVSVYTYTYVCMIDTSMDIYRYTYRYMIKMTVIGVIPMQSSGIYIYRYICICIYIHTYIYMGYTRRASVPQVVRVTSKGVTRCQLTCDTQGREGVIFISGNDGDKKISSAHHSYLCVMIEAGGAHA